ncbi:capsular polysaccharide biosynthesis protein [Grimontia indica]|uniref:Capsular polysaccharide biosynthesis protein n=1 Tax=Grimontia indica TaxID=1056512 RepID=R1GZV3_9GAMM|nr:MULTISPECIES: hypothetical protein [Grimontia]EOD81723.1 capsular polysaccharide biosynthesis protein [Grimontia indica]
MFLIASAAFCGAELQSEFGALPPSFLPLGNRRLFQHQISRIAPSEKIFLTLPETFSLDEYDQDWLKINKVTTIFLPEQLGLGESIVAALNLIDFDENEGLTLLYGDTLLLDYPKDINCIAVSQVKDNYQWAYLSSDGDVWLKENSNLEPENTHSVVNGFFNFEHPSSLVKSLIHKRWNFLDGINHYHGKHPMKSVHVDDWLDFGHIHTYFHSKAAFTTQRSFNELEISADSVKKTSENNNKIMAEALWFEGIPSRLRKYLPQLLNFDSDERKVSYELEYLHHTALNELYVFSRLPVMTWKRILTGCFNFIDACLEYKKVSTSDRDLERLFIEKTEERLELFCNSKNISRDKVWSYNSCKKHSVNSLISLANKFLPSDKGMCTVVHGDFCFSNILFDFRTSNIKTVDPRGLTSDGEFSIYGDIRYDLAKLSHSIIGGYDWIIAGYYKISHDENSINFELPSSNQLLEVQKIFIDNIERKYSVCYRELLAMQLHLFLSMLPLHSDDENRQMALFSNAFRIADLLEESL